MSQQVKKQQVDWSGLQAQQGVGSEGVCLVRVIVWCDGDTRSSDSSCERLILAKIMVAITAVLLAPTRA